MPCRSSGLSATKPCLPSPLHRSPRSSFPNTPFVVIDAIQGRVLHVEDLTRFHGAARVFPIDPVRTPEMTEVTLPLPDQGDGTLLNDDIKVFNCVDRGELHSGTLFGQDVDLHVCSLLQTATADPVSGDFLHHVFEGHRRARGPLRGGLVVLSRQPRHCVLPQVAS